MEKNIVISLDKKYNFTDPISIKKHKDKILVISVTTACWIVLDNEEQLRFFQLLRRHNIFNSIREFNGDESDYINVVTQIEARGFDSKEVLKSPHQTMQIYLTNKCNLSCPHCYMNSGIVNDNELSTEEVLSILKFFRKKGGKSVIFSGGEISLRSDLLQIVKYAFDLGLKADIFTNGTKWSEENINLIAPLINRVQISIDGYSEEENSKVRGRGNFIKSLKALDLFIKNRVKTELAITPLYDNSLCNKQLSYIHFAEELRDKYKDFEFEIKFTTGLLSGRELDVTPAIKKEYSSVMTNITNIFNGEDVMNYSFINSHRRKMIFDNCTYGCLNVSSNGDIHACSRITSIKPFANIRKDTFASIYEQSQNAQALSNVINLDPCNSCDLMYICGGGCRIENFKEFLINTNFKDLSEFSIEPRSCNEEIKQTFYNLMINTNEQIFT